MGWIDDNAKLAVFIALGAVGIYLGFQMWPQGDAGYSPFIPIAILGFGAYVVHSKFVEKVKVKKGPPVEVGIAEPFNPGVTDFDVDPNTGLPVTKQYIPPKKPREMWKPSIKR